MLQGLLDRSLLHMSLNQVELALKNATSKSNTSVSMYQFDPAYLNSMWEIVETFFSIMERNRKGSDLRKKRGGHQASNKNIRIPS